MNVNESNLPNSDESHNVERGDEIVVDGVADSRQPMTVRVVYHSGAIKAIDQFNGRYAVSAGDVGDRVDVVNDDDNRTLNDYVDLGGIDKLQLDEDEDDDTDHWGQPLIHHDDQVTGAGQRCKCQRCGSRHNVALVAGTDPDEQHEKWQECYQCQTCGAEGSLRATYLDGQGTDRTWTGDIGPVGVLR